MTLFRRWKQTALHNKALVLTSVLVAFGTVFYAGAAAWQLYFIKQTAKDQSAQFDLMSRKADSFVGAMNTSNAQAKAALETTANQIKASLEASARESKAALDASIATSRLDQRPWLRLDNFLLTSEPEDGKEILVSYSVLNSGKTPALEETIQSRLFLWPGMPPLENFAQPLSTNSTGVITPGDTNIRSNSQRWTPENPLIDNYKNGAFSLYLQAIIRYRDSGNTAHWTRVCAYHVRGAPLTSFNLCPSGNDMDH